MAGMSSQDFEAKHPRGGAGSRGRFAGKPPVPQTGGGLREGVGLPLAVSMTETQFRALPAAIRARVLADAAGVLARFQQIQTEDGAAPDRVRVVDTGHPSDQDVAAVWEGARRQGTAGVIRGRAEFFAEVENLCDSGQTGRRMTDDETEAGWARYRAGLLGDGYQDDLDAVEYPMYQHAPSCRCGRATVPMGPPRWDPAQGSGLARGASSTCVGGLGSAGATALGPGVPAEEREVVAVLGRGHAVSVDDCVRGAVAAAGVRRVPDARLSSAQAERVAGRLPVANVPGGVPCCHSALSVSVACGHSAQCLPDACAFPAIEGTRAVSSGCADAALFVTFACRAPVESLLDAHASARCHWARCLLRWCFELV